MCVGAVAWQMQRRDIAASRVLWEEACTSYYLASLEISRHWEELQPVKRRGRCPVHGRRLWDVKSQRAGVKWEKLTHTRGLCSAPILQEEKWGVKEEICERRHCWCSTGWMGCMLFCQPGLNQSQHFPWESQALVNSLWRKVISLQALLSKASRGLAWRLVKKWVHFISGLLAQQTAIT